MLSVVTNFDWSWADFIQPQTLFVNSPAGGCLFPIFKGIILLS